MVSFGEKAKIKKAGNLNYGRSYVITTVAYFLPSIVMVTSFGISMISQATAGKHGGFAWILHYTLYWFLPIINCLNPGKLKKYINPSKTHSI